MQFKNRVAVLAIVSASLALSCRPASESPATAAEADFQDLVNAAVEGHETDFGAALHVDVPAIGLGWEGAAGVADPATGEPITLPPGKPARA